MTWLSASAADGRLEAAEAAILRFHDEWRAVAAFMNARGLLHFDLHATNVLTDGEHIYVADFGLAICDDFDLSPAERAFFETHRLYDRAYVPGSFVGWLTAGDNPPTLTPGLRALVRRYGPLAKVFWGFIIGLRESKRLSYPAAEIDAALAALADQQ